MNWLIIKLIKFIKVHDFKFISNYAIDFLFIFYVNNMFVFNETYYYKTYVDHPKMNYDLYKPLILSLM